MDHRDVLADAVIGLHLKAPPISPHRRAGAVVREFVGNFVALNGVVETGNFVAKLLAHIHDLHHFIRAVAVHVNQDVAVQNAHERVELEISRWRIAALISILVPFTFILDGLCPSHSVSGDIPHSRVRRATWKASAAISIDTLWVFAARHFERIGRVWKLHTLHGP